MSNKILGVTNEFTKFDDLRLEQWGHQSTLKVSPQNSHRNI
jgi:hypothetical protein